MVGILSLAWERAPVLKQENLRAMTNVITRIQENDP